MKTIRRVLFAVHTPGAARQPGLGKAIQVAKAFGARLDLFHALNNPVIAEISSREEETVDKLRERIEGEARIALVRMCAVARRHGVRAESWVEWDYPPHEAIVRRSGAIGADLIVAESHKGVRTRPWLIHLTDWELLRTSPLPVLLIKNDKPYRRPLTLASVDPAHAHAKPRALDAEIFGAAREFSQAMRGALHMAHANHPTIVGLPEMQPTASRKWATLSFEELKEQERQAFENFREQMGIMRTRAHIEEGNPAEVIPRLARKLRAGVVVMGALSRSGITRIFIGNTAERVLESLPCDVLVVKPREFATRVARKPKGMRVISPTTLAPLAS